MCGDVSIMVDIPFMRQRCNIAVDWRRKKLTLRAIASHEWMLYG